MNFAPVADVSTDPADFIYERALGQDAQTTADYVAQVVTAMGQERIGSVLKHFPGYGNNQDTHTGVAVDERPYETMSGPMRPLRPPIFSPFRRASRRGRTRCW